MIGLLILAQQVVRTTLPDRVRLTRDSEIKPRRRTASPDFNPQSKIRNPQSNVGGIR